MEDEVNIYNILNLQTKLKGKLSAEDEEKLKTAVADTEEWLKNNQNNDKEDYEEELRELEKYLIII